MSEGEVSSLLIDNGTFMIKSGFSGDCAPKAFYPSVAAYPKSTTDFKEAKYSSYVGDQAVLKREYLDIYNIFTKGKVNNFDHYERLLKHNFYEELCVAPEEHPVVFTETTGTEETQRRKLTELMFETFYVPAFYIENDNLLSLYASGRITGMVLNIGEDHSSSTPIYEGHVLSHAVIFGSVAGSQINDHFIQLVNNDLNINNIHKRNLIYRKMKETTCHIALDYDSTIQQTISKDYELPDGTIISLGKEKVMAPEILFKPELFDIKDDGIDKKIIASISKSYSFLEQDLLANVLLSGGTTMFDGLAQRLNESLCNHFNSKKKIKVIAPPERKYSAWVGMSILSSLTTFTKIWITKEEYEDNGPSFIEKKSPSTYSKFQHDHKELKHDFKKIIDHPHKNTNVSIHFL